MRKAERLISDVDFQYFFRKTKSHNLLCVTKPPSQKGVDFICQFFGFRQEPSNINFVL